MPTNGAMLRWGKPRGAIVNMPKNVYSGIRIFMAVAGSQVAQNDFFHFVLRLLHFSPVSFYLVAFFNLQITCGLGLISSKQEWWGPVLGWNSTKVGHALPSLPVSFIMIFPKWKNMKDTSLPLPLTWPPELWLSFHLCPHPCWPRQMGAALKSVDYPETKGYVQ